MKKTELRQQAEDKLGKQKAASTPAIEAGTQRLLHELQVHQVELEMQNEELVQARAETEAVLRQYTDLYDFAPVGYFTLARDGAISKVNLAGAALLGVERGLLIKRRLGVFVPAQSLKTLNTFLDQVFSSGKESCEIELLKAGSAPLWVYIEAATDSTERETCRAVLVDISERKQTEETLKKSEQRFTTIFQSNPAAIGITQLDTGQLVDVNEAWQELTGYQPAEVVGHTPIELNLWVEAGQRQRLVKMVQKQGRARSEMQLRRKSGEVRDLLMSAELIELTGQPYLLTMAQDITERKRAEQALQENENKYRTLVQSIQIGLVAHAPDTSILFSNPRASQLLGLTPDQMRGKSAIDPVWCFIREDGTRMPLEEYPVNQALAADAPLSNLTLGILRPDREDATWVQVNAHLDRNPDGKLQQIVITFADITERKQAEVELRESRDLLIYAFNKSPLMKTISDLSTGKYLEVNDSFCRVSEFSREEVIGKTAIEFGWISKDERMRMMQKVLQDGSVEGIELSLRSKNGQNIIGRYWGTLVHTTQGDKLFSTAEDVTERKQAEQKLAQYSEHLEEMVAERTRELQDVQEQLVHHEKLATLGQIAGSVGHELRNPLSVINSAVYYLKMIQPEADEKVRKYHAMLEQEVRNAEKIINDLLDFARVKSVEREAVSVSELVQRVLERYPVPLPVVLSLDLSPNLPKIFADARHMQQVLGNLVLNACQAMKDGGQLSVISNQLSVDGGQWVRIAVKDTGVGIPPENMQKLFEPLFTTKSKGIGLGLPISQKLTEANGGHIEVQSEIGKGSTFTVYLPAQK